MPDFNILHPFFEIICSLISNSVCRLTGFAFRDSHTWACLGAEVKGVNLSGAPAQI